MISLIRELINYDRITFRQWLSKETFSKVLVFVLFLFLALGLSVTLYFFSATFFKYLFTFETFGQLTSVYILRASLLVVLWLGILSSFIAAISFLLTQDKKTDYLFSLPINLHGIVAYQNLKTLFLNTIIFVILIFPLSLAYLQSSEVNIFYALLRSLSLILLISLISESLGSTLGYLVANRFKKREGIWFALGATLLMVSLTVLLFRVIFPFQLSALYASDTANFPTLFSELPLNKFCIINNNLSAILISGFSGQTAIIVLFTIFLSIIAYQTQAYLFKETWQQVRVNIEHRLFMFRHSPRSLKFPSLLQKDILSIIRSPKEMGYGLFLFSLLLAFVGLFSRGIEVSRIPGRFSASLVVFSWLWLSFYSVTYFMRICFPSMSKEGKTRWWLFTLPISSANILNSKLLTSILFTIPVYLITVLAWWFIPFYHQSFFLTLLSVISITTLVLSISLLGALKPDYSLPDDPDKVSTGLSGIFALTLSLVLSGFTGFLIYSSIESQLSEINALNFLIVISVVIISILYFSTISSLRRHSVDIK